MRLVDVVHMHCAYGVETGVYRLPAEMLCRAKTSSFGLAEHGETGWRWIAQYEVGKTGKHKDTEAAGRVCSRGMAMLVIAYS